MRIILIFCSILYGCSLLGQESVLDQTINFSATEMTVYEALEALSRENQIPITFSRQFFDHDRRNSFSFQQKSLAYILQNLLQNTQVDYQLLGKRVLLFRNKKDQFILSGYLKDANTLERLIGATVYAPQLQTGTTTNEYGFYSLALPPGAVQIEYQYLGYEKALIDLQLNEDSRRNIQIQPSTTLQEILVTADNDQKLGAKSSTLAGDELSKSFLESVPGLGGEKDIVRAAQLLPGIQGGTDGLGGVQVRGSDNGHNLMLMDGVPVYIPFHLMGALSVYNAQTVQSTRVLKGSFSAKYGGRLASIFDIRTRDGNKQEWQAQLGGNFLNAQAVIEGPIVPERSSLLIGARYLPNGFLLKNSISRIFFNDDNDNIDFDFHDINLKWDGAIGEKDHLYFSFFTGKDNFYGESEINELDQYEFSLDWSNQIFALRWNHEFSGQLFSNLTLTRSRYNFNFSTLSEFRNEEEEEQAEFAFYGSASRNQDWALKLDFDYLVNAQQQWHFGAGFSVKTFEPEIAFFDEEESFSQDLDTLNLDILEAFYEYNYFEAYESFGYLEHIYEVNPSWNIRSGLRLSAFLQKEQRYFNWEPRLHTRYQLNKHWNARASYSYMVQYLHLISTQTLRLPNDIWLPAAQNVQPQKAHHIDAGLEFQTAQDFTLSVEGYYKRMKNLYTYPGLDILQLELTEDITEGLVQGEGTSYGIETSVQKNGKHFGGWLNYTLAWANRRFVEDGEVFSFPFILDHRHQVKSFLYYQFQDHLKVSLNYVFNSSAPASTIISYKDELIGSYLDPFGEEQNLRMQPYHRVDFNLHYEIKTPRVAHQFNLGAYNLLNRQNIAFYNLIFLNEEEDIFRFEPVFGMPFLPNFSYSLKF